MPGWPSAAAVQRPRWKLQWLHYLPANPQGNVCGCWLQLRSPCSWAHRPVGAEGAEPSVRPGGAGSAQGPALFLGNEALPPINVMQDGRPAGVIVDLARALAQRMHHRVEIRLMNLVAGPAARPGRPGGCPPADQSQPGTAGSARFLGALADLGVHHFHHLETRGCRVHPLRALHARPCSRRQRTGFARQAIALTGYTQPDDRAKAREAGFDAHLAKPLDLDKLGRVLEEDAAKAEPMG